MEINGLLIFGLFNSYINALTVKDFFKDNQNFNCEIMPFNLVEWYSSQYEKYLSNQFLTEINLYRETKISMPEKQAGILSTKEWETNNYFSFKDYSPFPSTPIVPYQNEYNPLSVKNLVISKENSDCSSPNSKVVQSKLNGKYTCRYEIQIKNEKEFQVAKRIIGSKGCHMKRIVNQACSNLEDNSNDALKLRLRGYGSGYLEGPDRVGTLFIKKAMILSIFALAQNIFLVFNWHASL